MFDINAVGAHQENHQIAPHEAAKMILAQVVGGYNPYMTMNKEIRNELCNYIADELKNKHPDFVSAFIHLVPNKVPVDKDNIEFITQIRDYILNSNDVSSSVKADVEQAREHALKAREKLAAQIVGDDEEVLNGYLEGKANLTQLRKINADNYVAFIHVVANDLRLGKVDTASLTALGLDEQEVKHIISNVTAKLDAAAQWKAEHVNNSLDFTVNISQAQSEKLPQKLSQEIDKYNADLQNQQYR